MADPVSASTLAGISIGSSALGSGLGVFGALGKGKSKQGMYNYQAGIADTNKRIQEQNAEFAQEAGNKEQVQLGLKQAATRGQVMAQRGASGIDVNSGSNVEIAKSLDKVNEMDRENLNRNILQKVRGHRLAAWEQGEQAEMYRVAGRNARREGKVEALTSLVSGAQSVSSKWLQAKQTGVFA